MSPSLVVWTRPAALRDAEVEDARDAVGPDEHVLGRHVPVHEAERLSALVDRLVRGVQAVERIENDREDHPGRQALVAVARAPDEAGERLAAHVLHDQEELLVLHHDVERRDDIRMLDARGEARLVEEHRREVLVVPRTARAAS